MDPSALVALYVHEERSRQLSFWRAKLEGTSLPVTHHGRNEIINTICRVAFIGHLDKNGMKDALQDFAADFANKRLHQVDILWRAALNRAAALSQAHTAKLGTRAMDILHVSCAVELRLHHFLTFDERQAKLAREVGLRLVQITKN